MIVGPLMWLMLHTISVKIKPEIYKENQQVVLDLFRHFYNMYPCKYCQKDAINYLDTYKNNLETQEELKDYVYNFHHHVNVKLYKKYHDKTILDKYNNVNLKTIFNVYLKHCKTHPYIKEDILVTEFLETKLDWFD